MADGVAITPGTGTTIATDEVGGLHYQRVKLTFGVDGAASDVSGANPLPVSGTFFPTTQPVSLAALPALPTGGNVIGAVTQSGAWSVTGSGNFAITAAALPLPTGAATETTLAALNTKVPAQGQAAMAASLPVAIASNQSALAVSGTFWQATQPVSLASLPALVAGAALIGKVGIDQTTPGTTNAVNSTPVTPTPFTLNSAATTNATSVKGSAGTLYGLACSNAGAAAAFVKLYNKATAPTVGTDVPVITIPIPASSVVSLNLGTLGHRFATGIALATTNLVADSDTTAVAANQVKVMADYV